MSGLGHARPAIRNEATDERMLRPVVVAALLGISTDELKRLEQRGEFPRAVRTSRTARAWRESTVLAWLVLNRLERIGGGAGVRLGARVRVVRAAS
ncbi:MAG: AlpA family phage regulatory protein [Candidatus Competibacter sp.]|jgi:predicted DNA-binding transcriptional regulator AlpA|nr:AlpA family phage regulatory protein [Candidatus Competibacter sp.]